MIKSEVTNGLYVATFENLPNMVQIRCAECDRWIEKGGRDSSIKHSSSCDSKAQPASANAIIAPVATASEVVAPKFNRDGRGNGLSSDELYSAVRRGYITVDEAMNTDF